MKRETFYYGIEIFHESPRPLKLQYVIGVGMVEKRNFSKVLEFERKRFFINGKEPIRSTDQLAERCMASIYPIRIELSAKNEMVSLPNLQQMTNRWKKERELLGTEFTGDSVEAYLRQMDDALLDERIFLKRLESDISYSLLLNRPSSGMSYNEKKEGVVFEFPVRPYKGREVFYGSVETRPSPRGDRLSIFKGNDDFSGSLQLSYRLRGNPSFAVEIIGSYTNTEEQKSLRYKATYLKNFG